MHNFNKIYDVAIIGAGIGGCELASYLRSQEVVLISQSLDHLANIYADQIEKNDLINYLGSLVTDKMSAFNFHFLVKSKLEEMSHLHLLQSLVIGFKVFDDLVQIQTWEGVDVKAKKIVLAVGSFLKSRLFIDEIVTQEGRLAEISYDNLANFLIDQQINLIENSYKKDYEVKFLTIAKEEVDNFVLKRFKNVYAFGACIGTNSYQAVQKEAYQLSKLLGE